MAWGGKSERYGAALRAAPAQQTLRVGESWTSLCYLARNAEHTTRYSLLRVPEVTRRTNKAAGAREASRPDFKFLESQPCASRAEPGAASSMAPACNCCSGQFGRGQPCSGNRVVLQVLPIESGATCAAEAIHVKVAPCQELRR